MEKQLSALGYWLGADPHNSGVNLRASTAVNVIPPPMGTPGGNAISYLSFFHGAALFFLLSIAGWCRSAKS